MKNLISKIFVIVSVMLITVSCKKSTVAPEPENPQTTVNTTNVNVVGVNWELYSGKVFMKNLDNNSLTSYDHFGTTKNTSNLDAFIASWIPFDIITKGMTTWKFTSSNQLVLDGTSNYNYNVNTNGIFNVYGLENSSSRIIEVLKSTNDYMHVKVYESNGNNGTNNFSFYTVLTFVRSGFTGTPTAYVTPNGYGYSGVINNPTTTVTSLVGTKWVVIKTVQNFVSYYPNDTLDFVSNVQYKINSSALRNYVLSGIVGNNMKSLSLYSFTTLGGDWSGQVQSTFINDWVVNNAVFSDMFNTNTPQARMWVKRIQ
jgi:hypothetical protein